MSEVGYMAHRQKILHTLGLEYSGVRDTEIFEKPCSR